MTVTMKSIGDPHTRVRFNEGMLLRAADLEQESLVLRSRDELATRALHGMGRLLGLNVDWDLQCKQLIVTSGLVVDGNGKILCVPEDRCASPEDIRRALEEDVERKNMRDAAKRTDASGTTDAKAKQDLAEAREQREAEATAAAHQPASGSETSSGQAFHVVVCHRDRLAGHDTYITDPCDAAGTELTATRVIEEARIEIRLGTPDEGCCQSIFPPSVRDEARNLVTRILAGQCDEEALCRFLRCTGGCFCEVCDACVVLACGVVYDVDCDTVRVEIDERPCPLLMSTAMLQEWLFGLEQELDRGPRVLAAGICDLDELDLYTHPDAGVSAIRTIGLGGEFAAVRRYLHDDCGVPQSRIDQMCDPHDHRLDAVVIELDDFARCREDRIIIADSMVIEGVDFALDGNATITRVMNMRASPPEDYPLGVVFAIRQPARETPPAIQFEITSYPRGQS